MGGFLRKYGWLYLPGLLFLGLSTYLQTLLPMFLGQIIDTLNQPDVGAATPTIFRQLASLLLAAIAVFATRFIWRNLIMGNSRNLEVWLRKSLFDHLLSLPVSFFQQQKTGNLMAYAINDIGAIRQTLGPGLALSASALVMSFLAISSMSDRVNPRLTWLALAPVPLILILVIILGNQVRIRFRKVQETFSAVSDRIQESISGIMVIKAHSQEEEEVGRFETLNRQSYTSQMRMAVVSAATGPLVALLFGASFTIGLIYGSRLVLNGTISLGDFVAFNGYLALIVQPVQSVARIINLLQRGAASWRRYRDVIRVMPAIKDGPGTIPAGSLPLAGEGRISIRNLTFFYPDHAKPALRNINLDLAPGGRVGILGRTGSGKTTLVNLLVRLHEPPEGSILLDGRPVDRLPVHWLRRQISLVPQDNFLFAATIEENINFFDLQPTHEAVVRAALTADLHETVLGFPEGYRTVVGERGMTLSGGQKQRVSLARALLKEAPILILDDTLSAVDTETEKRILTGLTEATSNRACLIIANRVSALQACDEILVLEEGEITERGTHEELLALGGFYATVARRQAGEKMRMKGGAADG